MCGLTDDSPDSRSSCFMPVILSTALQEADSNDTQSISFAAQIRAKGMAVIVKGIVALIHSPSRHTLQVRHFKAARLMLDFYTQSTGLICL